MKTIIVFVIMLFTLCGCKAQDKITLCYIGYQYKETKNNSFLNKQLLFTHNEDTLKMNLRLPFDISNHNVIDSGIFYNCHLKKGTTYTITLKKTCVTDIHETFNSYYNINTIPDKTDCSRFIEIRKNTRFRYFGNYGKYVDIDGVLYEIIGLSPDDDCCYPHWK